MHWSEVYGRDISANDIVSEAKRKGISVEALLRQWYHELGEENPNGGWDEANQPDFAALARQIVTEATR